ncbi:hypothetical protein ABEB36_012643 [Hypothenemus hampei]|uniref:Uncharacterized protein n=1 Tax=Hypothenemus hampei TaxID=57062 RepID=A0ABD1EC58_HYPHA
MWTMRVPHKLFEWSLKNGYFTLCDSDLWMSVEKWLKNKGKHKFMSGTKAKNRKEDVDDYDERSRRTTEKFTKDNIDKIHEFVKISNKSSDLIFLKGVTPEEIISTNRVSGKFRPQILLELIERIFLPQRPPDRIELHVDALKGLGFSELYQALSKVAGLYLLNDGYFLTSPDDPLTDANDNNDTDNEAPSAPGVRIFIRKIRETDTIVDNRRCLRAYPVLTAEELLLLSKMCVKIQELQIVTKT